jgi:hypothetical protein
MCAKVCVEKPANGRGEIGEEPVWFEIAVVACLAENPEHSQRRLVPHIIAGCWCNTVHDEAGIATSSTGTLAAVDDILTRGCSVLGMKHPLQLVRSASYCFLLRGRDSVLVAFRSACLESSPIKDMDLAHQLQEVGRG